MKRTTDYVAKVTQEFFESHDLNGAAVAYFAAPFIQDKIEEGYNRYKRVLEAAGNGIPKGAEEFLGEVLKRHTLTREEYEQKVIETFKEKFRDTFILASIYVPMSQSMKNLLNTPEDENQLELLLSAMDDVMESMTYRIYVIVRLCLETGIPLEVAEKIADDIGDGDFVLGEVELVPDGDEEDEDDDCAAGCDCCSGECGGHCNCEGQEVCRVKGYCHCDDGHK